MNNQTNVNTDSKKTGAAFGAESGLQEKIMKQIRELGDSLERAGERVEKSGWETIGQAIYKLGNSLEHLQDKKDVKPGKPVATPAYTDNEFDQKSKKFSDAKTSVSRVGGNDSEAL